MAPKDSEIQVSFLKIVRQHSVPINDSPVTVSLPLGRVVHVGMTRGSLSSLSFWFESDAENEFLEWDRTFRVFQDDQITPGFYCHVGTVQDHLLGKAFHLYEDVTP